MLCTGSETSWDLELELVTSIHHEHDYTVFCLAILVLRNFRTNAMGVRRGQV